MSLRAFAAGLLLVCRTAFAGEAPPDPNDPVIRLMLAPLRDQALRPAELIARLHLAQGAVVADVGAGPGFLTLPLARAVPKGRVIATDVHAAYLAVATRRAAEAGVRNIETRVVAPAAPGLAPRSVDLALLCQVDQYLDDRAAYFAALVPSLRAGGRIALVNYARFRDADLAAARAASLHVVDEWTPSPPFFLVVLAPDAAPKHEQR